MKKPKQPSPALNQRINAKAAVRSVMTDHKKMGGTRVHSVLLMQLSDSNLGDFKKAP